jgi:Delta7-sterol 5-desaturase
MELIEELLNLMHHVFTDAATKYFKLTIFGFLFFWLIFRPQLVHLRIQPRKRANNKIIFQEICYSFLSFLVFSIVAFILNLTIFNHRNGVFYDNYYSNISDYGLVYLIFSIFLILVIEDTYFYWTHRLLHHPKLYHHIHKIHHYSVDPTPFTTYSFHPLEATILFLGQILATSIFPVHDLALGIWAGLTLFNSVVIHLGYEIYPQWFTQSWLTNWKTPSTHHNMHHEKFKGNYALIFTWWDKLMGTEFSDYQARVKSIHQRKSVNQKLKRD